MNTPEPMPATFAVERAKEKMLHDKAKIQESASKVSSFLNILVQKFPYIKHFYQVARISGEEFPIRYQIRMEIELEFEPLAGEELKKYLASRDDQDRPRFPTEKSKNKFLQGNRFNKKINYQTTKILPYESLEEHPDKVMLQFLKVLEGERDLRASGKMMNRKERRNFVKYRDRVGSRFEAAKNNQKRQKELNEQRAAAMKKALRAKKEPTFTTAQ